MRRGHDGGFTSTELLVVLALMGVVFSVGFSAVQLVSASSRVGETQSVMAREVATPLHIMDKVISQNKQIYNTSPWVSDGYNLIVRNPKAPTMTAYTVYSFSVTSDGRLIQRNYNQATLTSQPTFTSSRVWSTHNANVAKGVPVFTYMSNGATTTPTAANTVVVTLWAQSNGKEVSSSRQIFFRNR